MSFRREQIKSRPVTLKKDYVKMSLDLASELEKAKLQIKLKNSELEQNKITIGVLQSALNAANRANESHIKTITKGRQIKKRNILIVFSFGVLAGIICTIAYKSLT